jgi:hypothetical protein
MRHPYALLLIPVLLAASDFRVDHVTLAGTDMKKMQAALSSVGIDSVYGGPHTNGATEMALVSFPDGSYLELMALRQGAAAELIDQHVWARFLRGNAGPTAWALREQEMAAEVQRLKAAGIKVSKPERSGRKRPDGVALEWETSTLGDEARGTFFPFLIHDFTPREQRAFPRGSPVNSDFRGVSRVVIAVRDLDNAVTRYRRAFSLPEAVKQADKALGAELATMGGAPVVLAQPLNADSPLAGRLKEFGEAPCAFVLAAAGPGRYQAASQTRWFGSEISWFDAQKLGWRLGFENVK